MRGQPSWEGISLFQTLHTSRGRLLPRGLGRSRTVSPGGSFPEEDPIFRLTSLKKGTARVGIVGGGYANGAPVPLPEEQADAEKYRQRIARLRQAVQLHERNIEALKKELSAAR